MPRPRGRTRTETSAARDKAGVKLRIRLKEPPALDAPVKKRQPVRCPLCWHGTWDTHLEKHQKKLECEMGQRRLRLFRAGLEPVGNYFPYLKKSGVVLERHPTDRVTRNVQHKDGKWETVEQEQERYWAPRWAIALCMTYEKRKRMKFFGEAVSTQRDDRRTLHAELRAMMAQSPEVQEATVAEARVFFKANLWHEEEGQADGEEAAEAAS